jgi:glutathione S-transferase
MPQAKPNTTPYTLYTFAMSHYSEKIRWTLDQAGIAYREVCMTPVFHMLPALSKGRRGQTTLPVLETPLGSIQDSPRIIDWLAEHHGPLATLPAAQAQAIREVEARFNAMGKDVARFLYAKSFGVSDELIIRLWVEYATPAQSRFIRLGYPLVRFGFRRKLKIYGKHITRAEQRIGETLDWLDAQLADGRRYLIGNRLTVADITAAALLAPLACPLQHPVYGEALYQEGMKGALKVWGHRRALQWVRDVYDSDRGTMNGGAFTQPAVWARQA